MLTEPVVSIRRRARRILSRVGADTQRALGAQVIESRSQVGGGALPTVELPTAAIALGTPARPAERLDEALRAGRPPVLGRLLDDRLLLDCRTVLSIDVAALAARLSALA
jgi:L-seryl-tRNA(Ser) seleniumtransferase